jgi:hypothetical protein
MASEWSQFLISAVRHNPAHTHITEVEVREHTAGKISAPTHVWTREMVVAILEQENSSVETIYESDEGNSESEDGKRWRHGALVRIVTIDAEKFIRTNNDQTKKDNLGNLPPF